MSINFFSGSSEDIANNFARVRPAGDTKQVIDAALKDLGDQFQQERAAAIAALGAQRTPEKEFSFGSNTRIASVTGSQKALQMLSELFASNDRDQGQTRG